MLTITTLAVAAATAPLAYDCPDAARAQTTYEINQCLMAEQQNAEIELTEAYRRALLNASRKDQSVDRRTDKRISHRLAIVQAQRAWIIFRDAHCQTIAFTMRGGSGEGTAHAGCVAEITAQRIEQLKYISEF